MIDFAKDASSFGKKLEGALKSLGLDSTVRELGCATYLDVSIAGISTLREYEGLVPCRSIWDIAGRRLAAVVLLGTT